MTSTAVSSFVDGPGSTTKGSPAPSFVATFASPDGPVGLTRINGTIGLYAPNGTGGVSEVTFVPDRRGDVTVHLASWAGSTGARINSFVFGNAPAGATSIEVSPETVVGRVQSGLFVVGLQRKDLDPLELHWRFLLDDGSVVLAGDGIK